MITSSFLARLLRRRTTKLFRAVSEAELEDIIAHRQFRNVEGLEYKYFARTQRQAETYARLATKAYGDGPFVIFRARIATRLITHDMCVDVENRIRVVVVHSGLLSSLSKPRFVARVPDT